MPRLGGRNRLNEPGKVVVQAGYFLQHAGIPGIVDEGAHLRPQGVLNANLHVVDHRLGVLVELFINPNSVR